MNFSEWLERDEKETLTEGSRRPGDKTGLYPLGYNGIGLYPLQDYLTHAADAITYISMDDRLQPKGNEKKPFDITHLKPYPTHTHQISNLPGGESPKHFRVKGGMVEPKDDRAPGKSVKPKGHGMPGKEVKPKGYVKLGKPREAGIKNAE